MEMKVGVIGLGVGYALSCCLAEAGYGTEGVDTSSQVLANPRTDRSVIRLHEHDSTHRNNISKHLRLSSDYERLSDCDFTMICVSTGDERQLVMGHVGDAVDSYCDVAKPGATMVVYSTLPFGSSKKIRQIIEKNSLAIDQDLLYVYMPLMIAQGTTADDFVNPPFVAFGSYSQASAESALRFYKEFIVSSSLWNKKLPPMFTTNPETAELAKLTANAFLSTKMSFANMTDMLCQKVGVDSSELLKIVGSDYRIGDRMLRPGFAWGGNCFPRDMASLIDTYVENGVDPSVLRAALEINDTRLCEPYRIMQKIGIRKGSVLVLGLAYKSGIAMTSGSKSLQLLSYLQEKGYDAVGYDPNLNPRDEDSFLRKAYEAVIITTEEPCFERMINDAKKRNPELLVLDYRMTKTLSNQYPGKR